jgi:hypothetical protein
MFMHQRHFFAPCGPREARLKQVKDSDDSPITEIEVGVPHYLPNFTIRTSSLLDGLFGSDVKTGDPSFDEAFVIEIDAPQDIATQTARILFDKEARALIRQLQNIETKSEGGTRKTLLLTRDGWVEYSSQWTNNRPFQISAREQIFASVAVLGKLIPHLEHNVLKPFQNATSVRYPLRRLFGMNHE